MCQSGSSTSQKALATLPATHLPGATSGDFVQGTSSVLWPAATALADYFCSGTAPGGSPWAGHRCLEVGAGLGLTGAVLAALGANVVLTDCDVAIPLLRRNQEKNGEKFCKKMRKFVLFWEHEI
eukprot:Skav209735  [mRNA]  locus=scaffold528:610161:610532:- [translate_table: standard]